VFPRRTVLVVIGVLAVMALLASVVPAPRAPSRPASTATPRPVDVPDDPDRPDVTATLQTNEEKPRTVDAELGDQVQITVDSTKIDSVQLGDLDTEPVEPGIPASFQLLADTPGSYPLVTQSDERTIGTLVVR
jgi:hypothetical protein